MTPATDLIVIRVYRTASLWWVQVTHPDSSTPDGRPSDYPTKADALEAAEQARLRRFAIDKNRPCVVEVTD